MNVVFDVGGVILAWQPKQVIAREIRQPETQVRFHAATFLHSDWAGLDRGTMDLDEAIAGCSQRSGLPVAQVAMLIESLIHSLIPIPGSLDLVRAVKARGHRVYVLSNMAAASVEYLERTYSFWDLFDGVVFSSRVRMIKPDTEIFHHLLSVHNLLPEETVFIDDTEINLTAAAEVGLMPIRFTDPQRCEADLAKLGCL